jgi:hypothetical protein
VVKGSVGELERPQERAWLGYGGRKPGRREFMQIVENVHLTSSSWRGGDAWLGVCISTLW